MTFFNDAVKWILRCLQDINKKNPQQFVLLFDQAKDKKIKTLKHIFVDYEYFGGLDVTNVLYFTKYGGK